MSDEAELNRLLDSEEGEDDEDGLLLEPDDMSLLDELNVGFVHRPRAKVPGWRVMATGAEGEG